MPSCRTGRRRTSRPSPARIGRQAPITSACSRSGSAAYPAPSGAPSPRRWGSPRLGDAAVTARIVLLDVNGTLTDPGPIGAPWGRPDLGERVLQTAMVDALQARPNRPY